MDEQPQAAGIPEEIVQNERAINLYMIAVGSLAAIVLLAIIGAIGLSYAGRTMPGEVWTVVGIAAGALAAMLGKEGGNG